jgi:rhodanese-related sulfurtransferase
MHNLTITSEELKKNLKSVTLVDVREPEEYEVSHIEGCKLIPLGELHLRATKELNPKDSIVLYCAIGKRSFHGVLTLQKLGFENIQSLEGGLIAWEEQNGPTRTAR